MKKISLTVILFMISFFAFSQINQAPRKSGIKLLSDDGTATSIRFDFGLMKQQHVTTPNGDAVVLSINGGTPMLEAGAPDLPKLASSIIIPDDKDMEVTVTSSHYTDISNINVAPSKGTLVRTIDPASVGYTYRSDVYNENFFFPKNIAELRDPYILRDYRGQTVLVYPFQYNAVTKTLRVYSDITVKISPKNSGTPTNVLVRNKPLEKVETEFNSIYQHQFLNYNFNHDTRYAPLDEHGSMLIICYGDFMDEMQPFVNWKIQEGIKTEMVDVATVGNDATSIKNYVNSYYHTNGLTFLLLVGDAAQVPPSSTGAGDSDNDYGYIDGSDHYQEIFVGRFSATTGTDVTTQVNRLIEYEKNPITDDTYAHGVGIASDFGQGIGDDGEADYEHEHGIGSQLLGYTYTQIQELFDGNHSNLGGNDANGNPSSTDLANQVNAGVGVINYTGHGDINLIVTTGFNNSNVDALTNNHHYPFIWIVGCQTGNFKNNTCFGEEWARHSYNGLPAGSIANFMSTINQYWAEPMEMQDDADSMLAEIATNNTKRTFGGLSINGCFSMNDEYGQTGYDMTDTWTIFGDPSVMVRTAQPSTMTVTHDAQIILGSTQFNVTCDFDGALAAITQDNIILGTATVSGGQANVVFDNALINADSVLITVTGFNKVPYIAKIAAAAATGPYLVTSSITLTDAGGNNNGLADYSEPIALDVTMKNVGSSTATSVAATLTTTDPFITITDNSESYGDIASNTSISHTGAFAFNVANNIPDAHVALFSCQMADGGNDTWTNGFSVTLNAPVLGTNGFVIDDSNGNNNGRLDPGETVTMNITNTNNGHADALNANGVLTSSSPYITISNPNYALGTIGIGSSPAASYQVSVDANAPFGTNAPFTYIVSAGSYFSNFDFNSIIAQSIEDFESGDFTQFNWQLSGNQVWKTESYDVFEGQYAARSGIISGGQSSTLMITLDVQNPDEISFMKKVSSEANYDSLSFHIDNVSMEHWSGSINWSAQSYPVTAGTHTFTWKYQKDIGVNVGDDCGYLDNIVLPVFQGSQTISDPLLSSGVSCYPNPFSQLTFIDFNLQNAAAITVNIFDVNGKLIRTILSNSLQTPGSYHLGFDGSSLANGTYFCTISSDGKTSTQKLVVAR